MDIEDQHPLRDSVEPHHISSVLTWCFKSKKKPFKHKLQQTMLAELGIKMPKSEETVQEDPYLILGYGVNAFFVILLSLCSMFCCISLFAIPIYYSSKSMGQDSYRDDKTHPISQFLLGNMGGATMFCHSALMEKEHLDISCPAGLILHSKPAIFGLISTQHE